MTREFECAFNGFGYSLRAFGGNGEGGGEGDGSGLSTAERKEAGGLVAQMLRSGGNLSGVEWAECVWRGACRAECLRGSAWSVRACV